MRFDTLDSKYNHKRRGKCVPLSSVTNNVTNNNNITNNTTNNTTNNNTVNNNVYVSFGSEDMSPITTKKFMNFLMQFQGPERLIPTAKALYFHPKYPENHGTLKPQSTKNKTVSVRKKDGTYYTASVDGIFNRFVKKVLPLILPDARCRFEVETELSSNRSTMYILSKELMTLINESPVISEEELEREFHGDLPPPPSACFRWPSEMFWEKVDRGFEPKKHIMHFEDPPSSSELFGVAALYNELVGETRLPPGVIFRTVDNGIDDRWSVVLVWKGEKWTRVEREPYEIPFTTELGYFFACMAVDLCDVMVSYGMEDSIIRTNFSRKLDELERYRDDLVAGQNHIENKEAMYNFQRFFAN